MIRGMEAVLWAKNVFCRTSTVGLLNVVYFYNCKLFGLRAGDEHRRLRISFSLERMTRMAVSIYKSI